MQYADVHGLSMAYREEGSGTRSIVFLHGNPTSSLLWRGVIPHVSAAGRCIAPDLIGMGSSAKLPDSGPGSYRLVEHRRYLDELLQQLELGDDIVLVIHDWGSALGFDWAFRHSDRVSGIAFMESIVAPLTWDEWPEPSRRIFQGMRSDAGEEMVLQKNVFVERILPASVIGELPADIMEAYRAPFANPGEDRRPTLSWPRELPIDGEPADVHEIVSAYSAWLAEAEVPKLHVHAEPGFLSSWNRRVADSWPNVTTVPAAGIHFLQEDSADDIGRALSTWLATI